MKQRDVASGTKRNRQPTQQEIKRREISERLRKLIVSDYFKLGGLRTGTWIEVLIERELSNWLLARAPKGRRR